MPDVDESIDDGIAVCVQHGVVDLQGDASLPLIDIASEELLLQVHIAVIAIH